LNRDRHFAKKNEFRVDKSNHRGTACCVKIQVPDESSGELHHLFVGVSHQKFVRRPGSTSKVRYTDKGYLSSLYAFEPTPPYRVVAWRGEVGLVLLCLPWFRGRQRKLPYEPHPCQVFDDGRKGELSVYNICVWDHRKRLGIRPRLSWATGSATVFQGLLKLTSLSSFDYYSIQLATLLL
jgi:hypothetical protein